MGAPRTHVSRSIESFRTKIDKSSGRTMEKGSLVNLGL